MAERPTIAPPAGDEASAAGARRFDSARQMSPRAHLLSNGHYSVMVSAAGSGFSRWRDLAVCRWREDPTCDDAGSFLYLRDAGSGRVWSAGFQPVGVDADAYRAEFREDRVIIERRDGAVLTRQTIVVSPREDAELRWVEIANQGSTPLTVELTSYQEMALAPPAADAAHPAFSRMFVQTEWSAAEGALLARRRPRDPAEVSLWAAQLCSTEAAAGIEVEGGVQFESDRARFIGRGRTLRRPEALEAATPLSGSTGTVLDPVLCLRQCLRIAPGAMAKVAFWTLVAPTREALLDLARRLRAPGRAAEVLRLAAERARAGLSERHIDGPRARTFQQLANAVLYANPALRAPAALLAANRDGAPLLWAHGISGDVPIVLLRLASSAGAACVRETMRAFEYCRAKRLDLDLLVLDERPAAGDTLGAALLEEARDVQQRAGASGGRGRIFLLDAAKVPAANRALMQAAARVVLLAEGSTLGELLEHTDAGRLPPDPRTSAAQQATLQATRPVADRSASPAGLQFFNGVGGFSAGGEEYRCELGGGQVTPAPWVNVIANPHFGFLVSAMGAGNTYSVNSREYQLTPWSNDPVSEPPGEAFFLQDLDSGALWCPTALPVQDPGLRFGCSHGQGYSRFDVQAQDIDTELLQFVPLQDAVKISRLRLTNRSDRPRRLSVTGYLDWVLGDQRQKTALHLLTERDADSGALWARNPWNTGFPGRIAFFDMGGLQERFTTDRSEFLGRHGSLSAPRALLGHHRLSGRVGGGFDTCAVLQREIRLAPGERVDLVFLLGDAASESEARELLRRYRPADTDAQLAAVRDFWDRTLGTVQVKTPEPALDLMLNRWLLYQTLACRIWARAGFYQASGAYGFRDQLQDVMTMCATHPSITRAHLLAAAARQFEPGDVQHWWLPSSGLGVRTRIADNRIWLPYVTLHYLRVTADQGVLEEDLPFLGGPALRSDQHEEVTIPPLSGTSASLYEHCARALDISLSVGPHGLPLFGTGDWNDGMNRVGAEGRGESTWMAWFLNATLLAFAPVAEGRGDTARATRWREHAARLAAAVEREAWDGAWYRRGYYDDGAPLGSSQSDECRIDSIAQSWGVISGAADQARVARAMDEVDARLVDREHDLIRLFTPAFDRSAHDPGYVKGYPSGLRENGGQYTHGAVWSVLAFTRLGDGDRAGELLSMINPVHHADTAERMDRYKVEPYVLCADLYTAPGHVGRGGWTWYTGSAGWLYRTALEGLLGFEVLDRQISIEPCIPRRWTGYRVSYQRGDTRHLIHISNPQGVNRGIRSVTVDGGAVHTAPATRALLPVFEDGRTHHIEIILG